MLLADSGAVVADAPPPPPVATLDANGVPISAGFYGLGGGPLFPSPTDVVPVYQPPTAYTPSPAPPVGLGPPVQLFGTPAQAAAAFAPTAFQGDAFPAGGAIIGAGGPAALPSGVLTFNLTPAAAWSQSSREQLAAIPSVPHVGVRPSLGGIGRVLAGLGIVGPHRLPRELERHAVTRTPLTP